MNDHEKQRPNGAVLWQRLEYIEQRLEKIEACTDNIKTTVTKFVVCPAPGLCLRLDTVLQDHEIRIRSTERWRSMMVGALVLAQALTATAVTLLLHFIGKV